jgi:ComF family protein
LHSRVFSIAWAMRCSRPDASAVDGFSAMTQKRWKKQIQVLWPLGWHPFIVRTAVMIGRPWLPPCAPAVAWSLKAVKERTTCAVDAWIDRAPFTRARAAGIYDQTLRNAIHALKFKGRVRLAVPLGALLFDTFQHYWATGDIDVVAPVPLHRLRFRRRGFNQAYLLVRHWVLPGETAVIRDLLVRHRSTAPQTGLDRHQRRMNIKNAFSAGHPGQSAGKRVLLVDDVLTTGATVDACAGVLIKDGAKRVDVLTLARAL